MSSLTPKQCVDEMRAGGRLIGRPAGSYEPPAPWTADGCPENGSLDETYWRVCSRTGVAWFSLTYERCVELLEAGTPVADAFGAVWRSRVEGVVFDRSVYDAGVPWSPVPWSPAESEGRKDDAAKPRVSLLPMDVLAEVIAVFEYGAEKYGAENWRNVEPAERYRDAAFRHVFMAEGDDPESGVDHLAHGIASLMILRALKKEAGE
jgi:hypothetical protein